MLLGAGLLSKQRCMSFFEQSFSVTAVRQCYFKLTPYLFECLFSSHYLSSSLGLIRKKESVQFFEIQSF